MVPSQPGYTAGRVAVPEGRRWPETTAGEAATIRGVRLSERQLNRATLARQLLLERKPLTAEDGLRRVVALQAQEPPSPYIALWNRLRAFDPADLDAAFASSTVVKATVVRVTLHAVVADDYPAFHAAMQPTLRSARLEDMRFRRSGLSSAEADELVPRLLAYLERPRAKAEIQSFLVDEIGDRGPGVWWALRTYAPLAHAPTGGAWSFGQRPSFAAVPARLRPNVVPDALSHLVRRYLEGFGPASVADISQFALIPRSVIREALEAMAGHLVRFDGPAGELFDVGDGILPEPDSPAPPRLLPMWDSVLLAYHDRSRIIPSDLRRIVIRRNGDVLPTLLVDGHVAGVWRPIEGGIEATAFAPLDDDVWDGLAREARGLWAFLESRDPAVYRRYAHWWSRLPPGETRRLPA